MTALFDDLDPSVRPADDLFRHVNGRWAATATIPDDQASTGSFRQLRDASEAAVHEILEELGRDAADLLSAAPEATEHEVQVMAELYRRFMDVDAVEAAGAAPLSPLLARIDAVTTTSQLMTVLGQEHRQGIGGLFYLESESDPADPTRYVPWTGQAGLGLPDEAYYREDDKAPVREAYLAHVTRMFELAGLAEPATQARAVMDLETEIASHHWDRVRCRDMKASFNPKAFDDLAAAHPGLHLDLWRQGAGIPESVLATVIDNQPSFFNEVEAMVVDERIEQWKSWARWHVVSSLAPFLSQDFVKTNFDFHGKVLNGTPTLKARWKRAVGFVEAAMGEALGKLYVARHFPPAAKERMDALVATLLEAYRRSIQTLDWMGENTRAEALDKLSTFRPKIGYPARWRDFSGLTLPEGGLVDAVSAVASFGLDHTIEKLSGPMDPDEWLMYPQTVNAYYHPLRNEIVFPAAILQAPFFDVEVDDAVNYGGIGAVIGHEIGHGFDDQGSTCDGQGRLRDWWTEADRAAFEERTKALIGQYDALVPLQLQPDGPHVNGALTIGENIGDLGGVGISFKALRIALAADPSVPESGPEPIDGFTWQQRFFLSYARIWREKERDEAMRTGIATDPHSPAEFRANQIVRNVDAFHEAFGVVEGDGLWLDPAQRVSIW
ncbi:M13 family metallopeptidase [Acidipropionibacterium timonense]|uniref:M13 family metallopeptidase n=1 Tax=Acidipropionibacterium timonense TaxID=2161818 RepID=UPI00103263D9|nr:M13-type metalloendopeptidase [Acidipropionibacterium timonense]